MWIIRSSRQKRKRKNTIWWAWKFEDTLFNPLSPWIYIYNTRLLLQAGTEAERVAGRGPAPGKKKKIPCLLEYVNNSCSQGRSNPSFHFSNMHSSCYHRLYSVQNTSCVRTRLLPPTIHKKPFSVTEPVFFSLKKNSSSPLWVLPPLVYYCRWVTTKNA